MDSGQRALVKYWKDIGMAGEVNGKPALRNAETGELTPLSAFKLTPITHRRDVLTSSGDLFYGASDETLAGYDALKSGYTREEGTEPASAPVRITSWKAFFEVFDNYNLFAFWFKIDTARLPFWERAS